MIALTSLIREHRIIARLVDALAAYAERLKQSSYVDPGDLVHFARAFREFTDEIHHEKEEGILLPILARNGFAWEKGVLPEVRRDHRQERYLIDVLCQAGVREGEWSQEERRCVVATALALVDFQREHMFMENYGLFPEVPRRLPPQALAQLELELGRFDRDVWSDPRRRELMQQIETLIERYAPAEATGPLAVLDPASPSPWLSPEVFESPRRVHLVLR